MSVIKLQPKPYIIESLIQSDDWDWPKALSEFIDNAFGQDAGNASNVTVHICADKIRIEDDGTGIDDLQRCFALGDSKSRHSVTDIGRYGVGAKHAAVWIGRKYSVMTCTDGKVRRADVDWGKVRNQEDWGDIQEKITTADNFKQGTVVFVEGFWPGRKRFHVGSVSRKLSETFAPALADGKTIEIIDWRRSDKGESINLVPWRPKGYSDSIKFTGEIGGRKFDAEVGILSDAYSSDTGLRICFAHRVICRWTKMLDKTLPVRLFGYIRLSSDWKDRLSTNKTQIVDSHDLEGYLLGHPKIKSIMDMADEYQYEILIDKIMPKLELALSHALRIADGGSEFARRREPTNEGTRTSKHPNPPAQEADEGRAAEKEDIDSTGITIKVSREGRNFVGRIEEDGNNLIVRINKDCPGCHRALDETIAGAMEIPLGLFSLIGAIFAMDIARRQDAESWLKKRLGLVRQRQGMDMVESFINWWMFSVADQINKKG